MKARIMSAMVLAMAISVIASAADFKVIVNSSNSSTKISKADLNAIFLKKMIKWSDGVPAAPVNQSKKSAVRDSFTAAVHGKSVAAVDSYWQQQIFSGRDVPPPEKASDAEVVAFVKSNPGAIGYVTNATATGGVKTVDVE
ncbi:MAG TPA: substrate-binding domain-containing protein [Thermoanaerobaculia bacterium]|nr:substrate-binding domain-containing protein [Thermoanaerobaculia bacterium]